MNSEQHMIHGGQALFCFAVLGGVALNIVGRYLGSVAFFAEHYQSDMA